MSLLGFDIFQRALAAAALVGLAAPSIGVYLVQRRLALMGDGMGHVAFAGVALALATGSSPTAVALVAAALGAVAIETLRGRGGVSGDVALALIFYGGIAGGVLFASLADTPTTKLFGYLFGQPLSVDAADLTVMAALSAFVLLVTLVFGKELFAVSYDEEVAGAAGLPVRALNVLVAVTAAVTVAVAMRIVGVLLVSAMLVLPVAAVQQVARGFKATVIGSLLTGMLLSVGGLTIAIYADVTPAATIVLSGIAVFAAAGVVGRILRR